MREKSELIKKEGVNGGGNVRTWVDEKIIDFEACIYQFY